MYESYNGEQKILLENDEWRMTTEGGEIKLNKATHLLGRREWDWYENACNGKTFQKRNLTFSVCDFGSEFTCSSGSCIAMGNRCDGINDCLDGSDEEQCTSIDIPNSYEKIYAPQENIGSKEGLHVYTAVTIETINIIDMKNMLMGVTINVGMRWKDLRLSYRNLVPGVPNLVSDDDSRKLWQPLDLTVHENAIVGRIRTDGNRIVSVFSNTTEPTTNIYSSYEDLIIRGEESWVNITQRFRIDYTCIYDLAKYPFDHQQCKFIMSIRTTPHRGVSLLGNDSAVAYTGRKTMGQFQIINATFNTRKSGENYTANLDQNTFIFTLNMKRLHRDAVARLMVPSFAVWLLAYLTLFINVEDFTNRNRISITLLLSLITLFASVSLREDFPTTAYFKYIDIWFMWYLINLFLIITAHIFLAKFLDLSTRNGTGVQSYSIAVEEKEETEDVNVKKQAMPIIRWINRASLLVCPIAMLLFNLVYFYMTV